MEDASGTTPRFHGNSINRSHLCRACLTKLILGKRQVSRSGVSADIWYTQNQTISALAQFQKKKNITGMEALPFELIQFGSSLSDTLTLFNSSIDSVIGWARKQPGIGTMPPRYCERTGMNLMKTIHVFLSVMSDEYSIPYTWHTKAYVALVQSAYKAYTVKGHIKAYKAWIL